MTDSLRIQTDSWKIGLLAIENTTSINTSRINWDIDSIGQKGFPDNTDDLRNAIGPCSQILQLEKRCENILK